MKQIKINSIKDVDQTVKSLKQEINDLRDALLNTQKGSEEYKKTFNQLIEDQDKLTSVINTNLKEIKISSIKDVFNEEEVEYIKSAYSNFSLGDCHSNAATFACEGMDDYDIEFVEGYVDGWMAHCFNKVTNYDDDVFYIDLTFELGHSEEEFSDILTKYTYTVFDEWNWVNIEDVFDEVGLAFIPHIGCNTDNGYLKVFQETDKRGNKTPVFQYN